MSKTTTGSPGMRVRALSLTTYSLYPASGLRSDYSSEFLPRLSDKKFDERNGFSGVAFRHQNDMSAARSPDIYSSTRLRKSSV